MLVDFVAVDVETANSDISSICQIGVAAFGGGVLVDSWSTLINPMVDFAPINIAIHSIDSEAVANAPAFHEVSGRLSELLRGAVAVCHTMFDRNALLSAFAKSGLEPPPTTWLDSSRVVRRTWTDLSRRGYGLVDVCRKLEHRYRPHDALEDAMAAGWVLIEAVKVSGIDVQAWTARAHSPLGLGVDPHDFMPNPEGILFGEVVVFTGSLSIVRSEAMRAAATLGCKVEDNVTRETSILVVGSQDRDRLRGHDKSAKHRKALAFVKSGHDIRVVDELGFFGLLNM